MNVCKNYLNLRNHMFCTTKCFKILLIPADLDEKKNDKNDLKHIAP